MSVPSTAAWDTRRAPGRGQALLLTLAGLLAAPGVVSTVLYLVPPTDDATALVAAFLGYGVLAYAGALLSLLVALLRARRKRRLAVVAGLVALLTVGHLAWLGPLFVPDGRPAATRSFTLLTLNAYAGSADPAAVARLAETADIVVLVETTAALQQELAAEGFDERLPYAVGDPRDEGSNTAVFSRFRLGRGTLVGPSSFAQWSVPVEVPDLGLVRLLAVHPCNPYCGGGRWYSEHERLRRVVADHGEGPLVVAGDFNAVDGHGPMQRLRRLGLRSATDLTGGGWVPTYPADRTVPPLLPIDHVLVNSALTVTELTAATVPGTDHRGLLVTIAGTQ